MAEDLGPFLDLAVALADAAGAIARRYFRTPVAVDDKPDRSPVTIADREAEARMREMITAAFPDHGILGEEWGPERTDAEHVWVLDPIDGTKSFITGRPLFGTLIALARAGRPILGVIDCSALSERWIGAEGRPTTHQGRPVRVRECPQLGLATLMCTSPHMFAAADFPAFERVRQAVKLPLYGSDCYAYGLVASGFADLVIEGGLKPYDYAAIVPVIEGAGGKVSDWQGRPATIASDGRILAAGDARAHAEALKLLSA